MDGIASASGVGAVASRFQVSNRPVSVPPAEPVADVASNALRLIHALLAAGPGEHVLDLKG